jgi:hypothetical protein
LLTVYVEHFPTHGGRRQISTAEASAPRWRADGNELYYHALDGGLMAVSVTGDGATLTTGPPSRLFEFRPASTMAGLSYVSRDGQRFLLSAIVEIDPRAPFSVVQNWTATVSHSRSPQKM